MFRRRTPFVGRSKPVSMFFFSLNISELDGSENREKANRNRSLPSRTMQKDYGQIRSVLLSRPSIIFQTSAGRTLLIGPNFQSVSEPKLASFLSFLTADHGLHTRPIPFRFSGDVHHLSAVHSLFPCLSLV